MSTAAFKKPSAPPQRRTRSLSVTPISRSNFDLDFSNKRDNPLFWTSNTSPPEILNEIVPNKEVSRGRSVRRNGEDKNVIGRSLSRVDLVRGRHRSLSRGPSGANGGRPFEREVEQDRGQSISRTRSISNLGSSNVKRFDTVKNAADAHSKRHPSVEPSYRSASNSRSLDWEDGTLSEAEEKTIKAVCEQMKSFHGDNLGGKTGNGGIYETVRSEVRRAISDIQDDLGSAIRRTSSSSIATADVTDIPPDLVNPGAIELVLDIRREYARKLEESQERARKLRADLAVEEHRGLELSRILKETLPNPKPTPIIQKPRLGRKVSMERKKNSKRLTDEAMSYFDECVSISTFDSSDFSAPEDPPLNSVGATVPIERTVSLPQESTCVSSSYDTNSRFKHKQELVGHGRLMQSCEDSNFTAYSSNNEPMIDQASQKGKNIEICPKSQFSFTGKPTKNAGIREDFRSYIKKFENEEGKNGVTSEISRSKCYDADMYDLHGRKESLLFDRVLLKNRVESGSLHICGGDISNSFSPFGFVI